MRERRPSTIHSPSGCESAAASGRTRTLTVMLPLASLSLSAPIGSVMTGSATGVLGVMGVAGDSGAEEERLPGCEGRLSKLSLLEVRMRLGVVAARETVDLLVRNVYRDGLDCGRRRVGGLSELERCSGEGETCMPGGRGKDSMLTALCRLGVGTRDGEGESEDATVRTVGIEGDDVVDRGMALGAARARGLPEAVAVPVSDPGRAPAPAPAAAPAPGRAPAPACRPSFCRWLSRPMSPSLSLSLSAP